MSLRTMKMTKKVIIAEDDKAISDLLKLHLQDMDCEVISFVRGDSAMEYLTTHNCDLIVLDINLPGMNGLDICRKLRSIGNNTKVLLLTAKSEEDDKVIGFESGADDYLTKPFSIREFIARAKAMLRRADLEKPSKSSSENIIAYRFLLIDKEKRRVPIKGKNIKITPKEFDLLVMLGQQPGVNFDRKALLNQVWGYNYAGYEHTVNSHINRLRSKIETDPDNPEYVLTTWGVGYKFNDEL